jgi:hypothetical protein
MMRSVKEKTLKDVCERGMSQPPPDLPPPSALTKSTYNQHLQLAKRMKNDFEIARQRLISS